MLGQVNDDGWEPSGSRVTTPATPEAAQWEGWGTALKPAHEPIVVARKPLIGTVAQNVLEHGTGGLNIDACRIGFSGDQDRVSAKPGGRTTSKEGGDASKPDAGRELEREDFAASDNSKGRWPANVVLSHLEECEPVGVKKVKVVGSTAHHKHHGKGQMLNPGEGQAEHAGYRDPDGTETVEAWNCGEGCPVAELDAQSGVLQSGVLQSGSRAEGVRSGMGFHGASGDGGPAIVGSRGGASRFFYTAKTSRAERNAGLEEFEERVAGMRNNVGRPLGGTEFDPKAANHHPTVKPINLIRQQVRLVTPPGGLVLDMFGGSGTTGCAAVLEGVNVILIEREPEYVEICKARIAFWAQHEGKEVEEVLGLYGKSQKQAKLQDDIGQASFDELLDESPA